MENLKILELFCGLGGWSRGFHDIFPDAEFYGVDIKDFGYPYNFIKADLNDWEPDQEYDIVLASPPCNEFTEMRRTTGHYHYSERIGLDLVYRTFYLISQIKPKFWVIENVWGLSEFLPPPRDIVRYGFHKCDRKSLRGGSKRAYLWGNFPELGFFEESIDYVSYYSASATAAERAKRAEIPLALSRQLAKRMRDELC